MANKSNCDQYSCNNFNRTNDWTYQSQRIVLPPAEKKAPCCNYQGELKYDRYDANNKPIHAKCICDNDSPDINCDPNSHKVCPFKDNDALCYCLPGWMNIHSGCNIQHPPKCSCSQAGTSFGTAAFCNLNKPERDSVSKGNDCVYYGGDAFIQPGFYSKYFMKEGPYDDSYFSTTGCVPKDQNCPYGLSETTNPTVKCPDGMKACAGSDESKVNFMQFWDPEKRYPPFPPEVSSCAEDNKYCQNVDTTNNPGAVKNQWDYWWEARAQGWIHNYPN
jgi:hypothetical protein